MKRITVKLEMDEYMQKMIMSYCEQNRITFEKFVEDAVFEKLEAENIDSTYFEATEDDGTFNGDSSGMIFGPEEDLYKKRH
jgi:hypothetical protein